MRDQNDALTIETPNGSFELTETHEAAAGESFRMEDGSIVHVTTWTPKRPHDSTAAQRNRARYLLESRSQDLTQEIRISLSVVADGFGNFDRAKEQLARAEGHLSQVDLERQAERFTVERRPHPFHPSSIEDNETGQKWEFDHNGILTGYREGNSDEMRHTARAMEKGYPAFHRVLRRFPSIHQWAPTRRRPTPAPLPLGDTMKNTDLIRMEWQDLDSLILTWEEFSHENPEWSGNVEWHLDHKGKIILGGGAAPQVTITKAEESQEKTKMMDVETAEEAQAIGEKKARDFLRPYVESNTTKKDFLSRQPGTGGPGEPWIQLGGYIGTGDEKKWIPPSHRKIVVTFGDYLEPAFQILFSVDRLWSEIENKTEQGNLFA